jgi:hypothetical protein
VYCAKTCLLLQTRQRHVSSKPQKKYKDGSFCFPCLTNLYTSFTLPLKACSRMAWTQLLRFDHKTVLFSLPSQYFFFLFLLAVSDFLFCLVTLKPLQCSTLICICYAMFTFSVFSSLSVGLKDEKITSLLLTIHVSVNLNDQLGNALYIC